MGYLHYFGLSPVNGGVFIGENLSAQEKNEANLVQQNIEADEQSDPMFRRMAAAFDAGGAKGLLLSHLPLAEVGLVGLVAVGFIFVTQMRG